MSIRSIPERVPVSDPFTGVVLQVGQAQALASAPQPDVEVVTSGEFTVRYGVRFLGKPHAFIVPGLVILDYGDMLAGEEAWAFLWKHNNLHPRSEVMGYRDDGREDIVFFRQLDMSLSPQVIICSDGVSVAYPVAFVGVDTTHLPDRLRTSLPIYTSVADWKATL